MSVADTIRQAISRVTNTSDVVLEYPADLNNGDYSTNVALQEAKKQAKNPKALAQEIVGAVGAIDGVEKIEVAGPGFINFYLSKEAIADSLEEARGSDMWGANPEPTGERILLEYTDPNPFKEFHIGHLMSNAIGESISRLFQFSGAHVERANYQGDVGPHVAKAIWALMKIGLDLSDPKKWPLGSAYVQGAEAYEKDETAKKEIDEINKRVYDRTDAQINNIYDLGREVSLEHFGSIYKILGTKFDYYFFESETGPRGVDIVRAHPEIFVESEGATVFRGEEYGLHTRVFLNKLGLPTYEAKDLGLAEIKKEKTSFGISITITANEQSDYFKVVFKALEQIHPEWNGQFQHIEHGMMRFAEGKMSSRKGNVITGEALLVELTEAARERAQESRADDKEKLSADVAVAAIKYQILKQASGKDIIFDRERALSLEGDSGPYLQYAHARAHGVTEKAKEAGVVGAVDSSQVASDLMRFMFRFPETVERAAGLREPHVLTNYLLEVASLFNSWYAQEQILDGTAAAAHKVAIVDAVRKTLKNGLWILGIPAPEKM